MNKCATSFRFPSVFLCMLCVFAPTGLAWSADPLEVEAKCAYCHGKAGASTEPDVPIIGGYSVEFLANNLKAYRDQERACPDTKYRNGPNKGKTTNMCEVAHSFTDSEIRQVAVHFSKKKFVRARQTTNPALVAKGAEIHELYCEKCHSDGGASAEDDAGMMAGQWMPYLRQSFDEFVTGKRPIPKKMKRKLDEINAEDMEALVHFYGSAH